MFRLGVAESADWVKAEGAQSGEYNSRSLTVLGPIYSNTCAGRSPKATIEAVSCGWFRCLKPTASQRSRGINHHSRALGFSRPKLRSQLTQSCGQLDGSFSFWRTPKS